MKNTLRNLALQFYIQDMYKEGCIKPEDMHEDDLDHIAKMYIFEIWTMQYKHIEVDRKLIRMPRNVN